MVYYIYFDIVKLVCVIISNNQFHYIKDFV